MGKSIKVFTPLFSACFLAGGLSLLLFFTLAAIQPLNVAAQHLESSRFNSISRANMTTLAPPALPLLQASSVATLYLPIIFRSPPLVYLDNFSASDSGWPKGDDGNCNSLYEGGRYRLNVDFDKECFRFAPKNAERTHGSFEVIAYHSEGQSNSAYGLYINGQGGNNYYIFRIWPNNSCSQGGSWEFIRNRNGHKTTLRSGVCNLSVKRGYGSANANYLKVKHISGGQITLYVNGVQLDTFNDASNELTGKGTGVYARAASNKDIVIKYDDFAVFASE